MSSPHVRPMYVVATVEFDVSTPPRWRTLLPDKMMLQVGFEQPNFGAGTPNIL
jgi:hypothetical protein